MGGLSTLASAGINLALAQQANKRASREVRRDRDREIAQIERESATRAREQQEALRARVAAIRARTGANGLASTGGSIDAVIRGLERDVARDTDDIRDAAASRIDDIRQGAQNRRRRNLLDLTTRVVGSGRGVRSLLR